jgi:hypothetical protein
LIRAEEVKDEEPPARVALRSCPLLPVFPYGLYFPS